MKTHIRHQQNHRSPANYHPLDPRPILRFRLQSMCGFDVGDSAASTFGMARMAFANQLILKDEKDSPLCADMANMADSQAIKHVVITGVSSGIGFALADNLVKDGYKVFGSVRKQEDADRVQKLLGTNFVPLLFDTTHQPAITEAASKASSISFSENRR